MAMLIAPETPYGKELWKWEHFEDETHPSDSTVRGMRPRFHREYPVLMYRATQKNPWKFDREIAADETMRRNLESRGFMAGGPQAAADDFDAKQQNAAVMAAVRNYEDRNLSDKAKAEIEAVESQSSRHTPEIPETPIRRRGRPAKAVASAA